jgi:hypothetical protein
MTLPLPTNPSPKRRVFLVLLWHDAIALLSFELDQLFILLVPVLVVGCDSRSFPDEPDLVKKSLSIKSKFVFAMKLPLGKNPNPKRRVFLVLSWHATIAIFSFELDKLFILLLPLVILHIPNEPDPVQTFLSIKSEFVCLMKLPLRINPQSKRYVFLVPFWHETIAIFSFKLDQLFILLIP